MSKNKGARSAVRSTSNRRQDELPADSRKQAPAKIQRPKPKSFKDALPTTYRGPDGTPISKGESTANGQSTSEPSLTEVRRPTVKKKEKPQFLDAPDYCSPTGTASLQGQREDVKNKISLVKLQRSGSRTDDSNPECTVFTGRSTALESPRNSRSVGRYNPKSLVEQTYKKANNFLYKDVFLEKVRLKKDDIQENKSILNRLKHLLDEVAKRDPTFPLCKRDSSVICTGSYYEKLKVGRPNEFDVMVSLNVSPTEFKLEYERDNNMEGYVKLKKNKPLSAMQDWLAFMTDNNTYLSPIKIRQRFFVLFEKVTKSENDITVEEHGPAVKLTLHNRPIHSQASDLAPSKIRAEVDVVLCIAFPEKWPQHAIVEKRGLSSRRLQEIRSKGFHVVPKTFENEVKNLDTAVHWRVSFSVCEKELLLHIMKREQKEVLKLVKFFRERYESQLPGIHSFHLKNLFLEQALLEKKLWDKDHFLERVVDILSELLKALKKGILSHFFNSRCNLLRNVCCEDRNKSICTIEWMLSILNSYEVEKIREIAV